MLTAAPAAFRQNVIISHLETPGAELSAQFEVMASPAKLNGIYQRLKSARATQEFRRRLTKKSKPDKRLPEVQVR